MFFGVGFRSTGGGQPSISNLLMKFSELFSNKLTGTDIEKIYYPNSTLVEIKNNGTTLAGIVKQVTPTYTSQRCSKCGWTRKSNRKGKQFKCGSCSFECDSDLNASINISLDLKPIGKKERLLNKNRTGFYWNLVSEERIVPHVQETKKVEFHQNS